MRGAALGRPSPYARKRAWLDSRSTASWHRRAYPLLMAPDLLHRGPVARRLVRVGERDVVRHEIVRDSRDSGGALFPLGPRPRARARRPRATISDERHVDHALRT